MAKDERRLSVRMDPDFMRELKIEATRCDLSLSDLARDLLSEWLEQREAMRAHEEQTKQK